MISLNFELSLEIYYRVYQSLIKFDVTSNNLKNVLPKHKQNERISIEPTMIYRVQQKDFQIIIYSYSNWGGVIL